MRLLSSKGFFLRFSLVALVLLTVLSWVSISLNSESWLGEILSPEALKSTTDMMSKLVGYDRGYQSAFFSAHAWRNSLQLSLQTFAMSVLAIGITAIAVAITFVPAVKIPSQRTASGDWIRSGRVCTFYFVRCVFIFTRGVPELLWAMFVVFVLSPGILTGAIALAIHNYGVLGKLCADLAENIDPRPMESLKSAGAKQTQLILYGVVPQILPTVITYLLYRWEVIIRTTVVIGFVAAGGLGRQFRLSLSWFHYDELGVILASYIVLVLLVDVIAAQSRKFVT